MIGRQKSRQANGLPWPARSLKPMLSLGFLNDSEFTLSQLGHARRGSQCEVGVILESGGHLTSLPPAQIANKQNKPTSPTAKPEARASCGHLHGRGISKVATPSKGLTDPKDNYNIHRAETTKTRSLCRRSLPLYGCSYRSGASVSGTLSKTAKYNTKPEAPSLGLDVYSLDSRKLHTLKEPQGT